MVSNEVPTFVSLEDSLGEGGVHVRMELEEDTPDLKRATDVSSQTAGQVERPRVSHLPYRSWCKQCVMGRGVGRPHAASPTESSAPNVGMDYFFITREGVRLRDQLAKAMA